jgi:L-threonylcarbamoyladenylate synthase
MRRWHIDVEPSALQLNEIARALAAGSVVLLPTDTIYGLHALALDDAAVARVADIKGRDETKPFVVLVAEIANLSLLGVSASPEILDALEELWPAPLTVILPLHQPIAASRGASTLAVRMPALPWLRELLGRTGPLVSTSANRSGERAVGEPSALAADLLQRIDAIADGGPRAGEPSTIVDVSGPEPRFLREGGFSFTQKVWKTLRKTL